MARPAAIQKKWRLSLELPEPLRARIADLRARTGAESTSEVIRRSLALYDLVVVSDDARLVLRKKNGTEETFLLPRSIV